MSSTPFHLIVTGKSEIPHPAERAIINVSVSSSGTNKASVSDEVITTAKHIETLLSPLSPQNESPEAKASAPLAHWSKTSLSSTSHVPYNHKNPDITLDRQYTASISFDIRFRDFKALGSFGTKLSSLSHVEVQNIDWRLTDATEKSFKAQLRKEAAKDAMQKARDYCEVLGCTNVRPVELREGDARASMPSGPGGGLFGNSSGGPGAGLFAQQAPQMQMARMARRAPDGDDQKSEDLAYDAQEVKMAMEITVKFQADHAT